MRPSRAFEIASLRDDPYLAPFRGVLRRRVDHAAATERRLTGGRCSLADFAAGHEFYGLHRTSAGWVLREWAPNADAINLVGPFTDWRESSEFAMRRLDDAGDWSLTLSADALRHGDLYKLRVRWPGGAGERIPAYARRVVQDMRTHVFSAQVWCPAEPYVWRLPDFRRPHGVAPLIYEAHVGMAQEHGGVGTYEEFRRYIVPRIADAGYNTIQLMAIMEHPYYGSFGYHVSNFFAASSRFGAPEDLKALIDTAHDAGLAVIMDLVHSHAARNENEGLSRFDGTLYQYFHDGERGYHPAWDSRCFDYGKPAVLHFLLSNCRFWLDEYRVDGFRFDGITSMLYRDHGLGAAFAGYDRYFDGSIDEDAMAYLALANKVVHTVRPDALTLAEDVSGMPGLGAALEEGGCGFDYRLALGVPDFWFKVLKSVRDEDWDMGHTWHELTNRRVDERTVSYVECHDQAIVGGKTVIFELVDAAMYEHMQLEDHHPVIERGLALHKLIRLATLATAGHGYLNFMGNEFGHPEWIDFPREGNNWSHHYARRQWRLRDDARLKYRFLAEFDRAMLELVSGHAILETAGPRLLRANNEEKVLAFERAGFVFVFNFHPTRSLPDYALEVPPGGYVPCLSSDSGAFGGQDRQALDMRYETAPLVEGNVQRNCVRLYLPARTALVLRLESAGTYAR